MLKRDNIPFGIVIGLALTAIFFGLLKLANIALESFWNENFKIKDHTILLLSIFINIVPIRYYFVNLKFDKTGRGVLLVTFILMVIFFIFIKPVRS
jgi:hypothetical protein